MEEGSGGSSNSSSSSSSSSINGFKFGKGNYFGSSPVEGSGGRPPPAPAKKGKKSGLEQGGGPRCQVEGCEVDLREAKAYHYRHRVCGIHSKSPKVIVAGLEQRFCQQCSRFHLLPEFDQGKRSCRRRLAGHNERRRKPLPKPLFDPCGSLSSPFLAETTGKAGSLMLDFSRYPVPNRGDAQANARTSKPAQGYPETVMEKLPPHPWNRSSEVSSSEILVQGSTARTSYFGSDIPSEECLAAVSDCSRALSLLSSQPWDSRDPSSSLATNGVVNANGTTTVQSLGSNTETIDGFSSNLWGFKVREGNSSSSQHRSTELILVQSSQPASSYYYGDLDIAQPNGREFQGFEHSTGYDSSLTNMLF